MLFLPIILIILIQFSLFFSTKIIYFAPFEVTPKWFLSQHEHPASQFIRFILASLLNEHCAGEKRHSEQETQGQWA